MSEFEKCIAFLSANGWESSGKMDDHMSFHKGSGSIGVDVSEEWLVFIGENGDFLHRKTDYYTLVGVLIEHRQIAVNYASIMDKIMEDTEKHDQGHPVP